MELIEVVPGSLYWLSSHTAPASDQATEAGMPLRMAYIHVEKEFPYQNFYLDFGPLHLAHVFAFARALDEKLLAVTTATVTDHRDRASDDNQHDDVDAAVSTTTTATKTTARHTRVCVYTSMVPQHRVNAVCLLGCWAILFHKWSAARAFALFEHLRLPSFHDASPNVDRFGLGVLDVLQGLEHAIHCGLFPRDVAEFDDAAFLDDMDPDTRDLTWITPQLAAFAGPQAQQNWFGRTKPDEYVEYFRSRGVGLIVRLNKPKYDKQIFTRVGIAVIDLYFPDGTCPSDAIVGQFLALCTTSQHGKVAVHCKAGLGRTGTLLACLLMHAFAFSAEQAIGWLRLCRPGSVIGRQQHFLREIRPRLAQIALGSAVSVSTTRTKAIDIVKESTTRGPEDASSSTIDEDHEQNDTPTQPPTKGIATRTKRAMAYAGNSLSSPKPACSPGQPSLLPPKIPGRRVAGTPSPSAGFARTSHASQGDQLLLRKHALHMQLPLGTSLWPPAPSVGGGN